MYRKHSCMPTPPLRRFPPFAGSAGLVSRRSRVSAKPTNLTLRRQSGVRGLRRDGCMGAIGRPARSLATKCQTNLVFPAGSAGFASAACGAPRKPDRPRDYCPVLGDRRSLAPYCRVLPVRSIAGYCRSRPWRSLAASGVLPYRARTSCSDCLDCLRPSERRSVSQAWSRCCSGGLQG